MHLYPLLTTHSQLKKLYLFDSVSSSNQFLMHNAIASGTVCIAQTQTQGKGRADHRWDSPEGGIYYSVAWIFPNVASIEGLSLITGIATATTLASHLNAAPRLKWPNDLWIENKKCGGILVENRILPSQHCMAIIGVGINYENHTTLSNDSTYFLKHVRKPFPDRATLTEQLLIDLLTKLQDFSHQGWMHLTALWEPFDLLKNHCIQFISGTQTYKGIARGINTRGALCVEIDGTIQTFHQAHHVRLIPCDY